LVSAASPPAQPSYKATKKRALSVTLGKRKSGAGIYIFSVITGYFAEQWLAVQHVNGLRLGPHLV